MSPWSFQHPSGLLTSLWHTVSQTAASTVQNTSAVQGQQLLTSQWMSGIPGESDSIMSCLLKRSTLTSCYLLFQSLLLGAALDCPRECSKWLESKPALVWADAVRGYCRLALMVWGCWYRRLSSNRSRSPVKMYWSCWNSSNIFQKVWTPDLNMLLGNGFTSAIGTARMYTTGFDAPFLMHFQFILLCIFSYIIMLRKPLLFSKIVLKVLFKHSFSGVTNLFCSSVVCA